jgi:hypothetical protein
MEGSVLYGIGESAATISRAVERGWVILLDGRGSPTAWAALTEERWARGPQGEPHEARLGTKAGKPLATLVPPSDQCA